MKINELKQDLEDLKKLNKDSDNFSFYNLVVDILKSKKRKDSFDKYKDFKLDEKWERETSAIKNYNPEYLSKFLKLVNLKYNRVIITNKKNFFFNNILKKAKEEIFNEIQLKVLAHPVRARPSLWVRAPKGGREKHICIVLYCYLFY